MANNTLFGTALLFGSANLLLSILYYRCVFDSFVLLIGVTTSVLNHHRTNGCIKWVDRVYVTAVFLANTTTVFYEKNSLFVLGNVSAAVCYILSKLFRSTALHVLSHILITSSYAVYYIPFSDLNDIV